MIQEAYEYLIRFSLEFWSVVFYSACSDPRFKMEEGEFWFLCNQTTKYKMHYLIYYVVRQRSRTSTVHTRIMPPAITYCYSYLPKNIRIHARITCFLEQKATKRCKDSKALN